MGLNKPKNLTKTEKSFQFEEIKQKVELTLKAKLTVEKQITQNEARTIEDLILEENAQHKHMIEKSAQEIQKEINSGLGILLKLNGKVAGTMSMIDIPILQNKNMYEAGSLIVHPEYRKKGLAKILSHDIFDHNKDKAIYSITEVPGVMHIYNEILKLHQFTKFEVHPEILSKIEEVGPLLPTDIIYGNDEFKRLNEDLIYKNFTGGFNNI